MTERIIKEFESSHGDREVTAISLVNGVGVDGLYVITAPLKNADNPYEPNDFLFSLSTRKAKMINPTEDIDTYVDLMSNTTELWIKES